MCFFWPNVGTSSVYGQDVDVGKDVPVVDGDLGASREASRTGLSFYFILLYIRWHFLFGAIILILIEKKKYFL